MIKNSITFQLWSFFWLRYYRNIYLLLIDLQQLQYIPHIRNAIIRNILFLYYFL